jgi:hypothetical protein
VKLGDTQAQGQQTTLKGLNLFLAVSALFGGWVLMKDPTGGIIYMPVENMKYSPFSDYLIPGIILFVFNGLFNLAIKLFPLYALCESFAQLCVKKIKFRRVTLSYTEFRREYFYKIKIKVNYYLPLYL